MKIVFYADWELALTYLKPLYDYIKSKEPQWDLYFNGNATFGDLPVKDEEPDLAITCDELSACKAKKKICIFHGLASKGQAFSTAREEAFVNYPGLLAVPSEYYRQLLLKMGVSDDKIFISGLTKHDKLQRKILYAPTHNPQLSAIPVIKDRIYELDNVKVHLHQWIRLNEKPHHKEFMSYHPVQENREDILDLIDESDVIIGDMGSIVLEAIALGKQAIQVINPEWKKFYYKKGLSDDEINKLPEVELAKYAIKVKSFDELKSLLELGSRTGRASQTIYEKIKHSCSGKT